MNNKRMFRLFALMTACLLALAACSPPSSPGGGETSPQEPGAASDAAPAETPSASGQKVVSLAMSSTWDSLMPYNFSGNAGDVIADMIFERLVTVRFDGQMDGRLATDWSISEDHATITIQTDPQAVWSDGTPLTAHDLVFTSQLITDPAVTAVRRSYFNILSGTDETGALMDGAELGVAAPDDHTAVFSLKEPMDISVFLNIFNRNFYVLPKHALEDIPPEQMLNDPFWQKPTVTSGPFLMTGVTAGERVEMDANPNFYKGQADFDKLIIKVVPGANLLAGLISGDIDILAGGSSGAIPLEDWETTKAQDNLVSQSINNYGYQYMAVNQKKIPKEVRQAVSIAIDRQLMVDSLMQGEGVALSVPFPAPHPYHNPDMVIPHDLEKAKELVESSGFDTSQTLTLSYPQGNVIRERSAPLIQQDLAKIGLNVTLESLDFPTLLTKLHEGQTDFGLIGASGALEPDEVAGVYVVNSTNNFACIEDDAIEQLCIRAASGTSFEERKPMYDEWMETVIDESYYVYLYSFNSLMAYNNRLSNVNTDQFSNLNWSVWEWKVAD